MGSCCAEALVTAMRAAGRRSQEPVKDSCVSFMVSPYLWKYMDRILELYNDWADDVQRFCLWPFVSFP